MMLSAPRMFFAMARDVRTLPKSIEPVEGQFHLPGGFTIPAVALLLSLWLTTHASMESWLVTVAFGLLGSVLYALARN